MNALNGATPPVTIIGGYDITDTAGAIEQAFTDSVEPILENAGTVTVSGGTADLSVEQYQKLETADNLADTKDFAIVDDPTKIDGGTVTFADVSKVTALVSFSGDTLELTGLSSLTSNATHIDLNGESNVSRPWQAGGGASPGRDPGHQRRQLRYRRHRGRDPVPDRRAGHDPLAGAQYIYPAGDPEIDGKVELTVTEYGAIGASLVARPPRPWSWTRGPSTARTT